MPWRSIAIEIALRNSMSCHGPSRYSGKPRYVRAAPGRSTTRDCRSASASAAACSAGGGSLVSRSPARKSGQLDAPAYSVHSMPVVVRGLVERVVGPLAGGQAHALLPLLDLERAVADRLHGAGLDVVDARLGDREEAGVAEHRREAGERAVERDLEGQVVDDVEARQRVRLRLDGDVALVVGLALHRVVALDALEEVVVRHRVGAVGGVVPRPGERLGIDRLAVLERQVGLDRDRPHLVVGGLDALGDVGVRLGGLGVVADQAVVDDVEHGDVVVDVRVHRQQRRHVLVRAPGAG